MSATKLKLPALGFLVSKAPCSECCEIVVRESVKHIYSGQQETCYACSNPLTVHRIADDGGRATDFVFERGGIAPTREYEVVEVMFNNPLYSGGAAEKWLGHYGLEGFKRIQSKLDWTTYRTEKATPEATVVVMLDEGVVGRVLTKNL